MGRVFTVLLQLKDGCLHTLSSRFARWTKPHISSDRSQAFFLIELKTRKVIHVGVTRSPTDAWVARTAAGSDA